MKITKKLNITSPTFLWSILKHREDFYKNNQRLCVFVFSVERYVNGCRCDSEVNIRMMNDEYDIISNDPTVSSELCKEFNCDEIIFHPIL